MAVEVTTAQAPPRSAKTANRPMTTSRPAKARQPSGALAAREEAVNGLFQVGTFGLIIAGQHADAGALGKYGPSIATEIAKLAEVNDGVAHVVDYLLEAGPYAGLITAVMPLALQVMVNHKMAKAEHLSGAGVVPPETLAAQVKTDMARQQIEALQAQQAAEAEMSRLMAETTPKSESPPTANGQGPTVETH
jgi:hypothetical protein